MKKSIAFLLVVVMVVLAMAACADTQTDDPVLSTGAADESEETLYLDNIPEDLKYRADVRFDNRGSGWAPAIASIALVIFLTALLCWLLPHVLWLADAIISLAAPG